MMTRGIMTLAAKRNNYERLINTLFKKYSIPLTRPEYEELMTQGENVSKVGLKSSSMDKHFEDSVKELSEKIKTEETASNQKKNAQELSVQIASQRSLAPVRLNNSQMLMAYPWFSPDQKERKEVFTYRSSDGKTSLTVIPSALCGAAKVWDGDVLMYALSKAVTAYLDTREFPRKVRFSAYEYLKQANKSTASGKNVSDLKDKLERLSLTQYKSTLLDPDTGIEKGGRTFKLCDYEWINDTSGQLDGIEIKFTDELFEYFATKNDLLTLKKDLLLEAWKEERSGLRKRLLMLVGTRLGNQQLWKVGLTNLKNLCGYTNELKYFKRELIKIATSLPWIVDIEKNPKKEDIVSFIPKPAPEKNNPAS
jgi:hypothetical protein